MTILTARRTLKRLEKDYKFSTIPDDQKDYVINKGLLDSIAYELNKEIGKNRNYREDMQNRSCSGNPFIEEVEFNVLNPIQEYLSNLYIMTEEEFLRYTKPKE